MGFLIYFIYFIFFQEPFSTVYQTFTTAKTITRVEWAKAWSLLWSPASRRDQGTYFQEVLENVRIKKKLFKNWLIILKEKFVDWFFIRFSQENPLSARWLDPGDAWQLQDSPGRTHHPHYKQRVGDTHAVAQGQGRLI